MSRVWTDRVVQYPNRYTDQNNNQYTFTPDAGTVINAGTPITAVALNGIESDLIESSTILTPTGSANAIVLPVTLADKKKYSFKATATSTGNVTINGIAFKKLDGTVIGSGGVKINKVYDVYLDSSASSVFILAKAEGDALVGDVLASKVFSNGDDTGLVGTLSLTGNASTGDVLAGKTYYTTDPKVKATGTMKIHNTSTNRITPSTNIDGSSTVGHLFTKPETGFFDGLDGWVDIIEPNFIANNIVTGKNVFGLIGTFNKIYGVSDIIAPTSIDTTIKYGKQTVSTTFGSTIVSVKSVFDNGVANGGNRDCIVGLANGTVMKMNIVTGVVAWTIATQNGLKAIDVGYVTDGQNIVVLAGNKVYKLNPTTGAILYTSIALPDTNFIYANIFYTSKVIVYNPTSYVYYILDSTLSSFLVTGNAKTSAISKSLNGASTSVYDKYLFGTNPRYYALFASAYYTGSGYYHTGFAIDNNGTIMSSTINMSSPSDGSLYDLNSKPCLTLRNGYNNIFKYGAYNDYSYTNSLYCYEIPDYSVTPAYGCGPWICVGSKIVQEYEYSSYPWSLWGNQSIVYTTIESSPNKTGYTSAVALLDYNQNSSNLPLIAWAVGSTLYYNSVFGYKISS